MTISPSTLSPKFSGVKTLESPKLSAIELDKEFVQAFENLDLKRATEFLKLGANPNQEIILSRPIVAEFLKLHSLSNDYCSVEEFLADDENFRLAIDEFFSGGTSLPALLLSLILNKEDFALLLLESGAEISIPGEEDGFNILQYSTMMSHSKIVKFILQTTSYRADHTDHVEVPPPFIIAVQYGNLETVQAYLEICPDQLDSMIIDLLKSTDIQDEVEDGNSRLIEIKELLEDHLKRKEMSPALKV